MSTLFGHEAVAAARAVYGQAPPIRIARAVHQRVPGQLSPPACARSAYFTFRRTCSMVLIPLNSSETSGKSQTQ